MPRDPLVYLDDIVIACDRVLEYTAGKNFSDFERSPIVIDAVLRNLEVIGEAVKNVPEETRRLAPDLEWKRVGAFRDVLAHQYFSVKLETVWDVVQTKIPALRATISKLLSEAEPRGD